MKKTIFTGSAPAIVTPFTDHGIDFAAFEKLLDFHTKKSDALVICGTTGEPSTMTEAEKRSLIEFAIKFARGKKPVIIGTGGNCTTSVIEDSKWAEKAGADALLIVTPYYNKATQNGLVAHYLQVADSVGIPIIAYNVPGRTGLNMTAATLNKIADHKNIAAMKEASGNMEQVIEMASLCGDKLDLYSGDDALVLPVLSAGGKGVISVTANIVPELFSTMVTSFLSGDVAKSRELQLALYPLIKSMFCEVNPIPVKYAASLMGFGNGKPRMPLTPIEAANAEKVRAEMQKFGLVK